MSWKHAAGKFFCSIFCAAGFLVFAILLLNSSVTEAVDKYWNVASGDWSDTSPCSWNPSPEPTSSDNAYINNNGTANITQSGEVCNYLYLGQNNTNIGTIQMTGGSLSTGYEYIGYFGIGVFNHSAGTNAVSGLFHLGNSQGSIGTYNLSGTGQLNTSFGEDIGYGGMDTFNQSGGINNASYLDFGSESNYSIAIYNLTGGILITSSIWEHSFQSQYYSDVEFNFGGGTLKAGSNNFYINMPLKLTGDGGNANIDTAGYGMTLNVPLWGPGGLNKLGNSGLFLNYQNYFTGSVNFSGGFIYASKLRNLGNGTELNFNGGGLSFGGVYDPSVRTMTFQSGGATLSTGTNNITLANPVGNGGSGGLTKLGSGTLTLNALNTYSGDTIVNGGTLEIAGGIDASGTSLIDVQSGTAILKTVNVNKTNLNITTAALAAFEVLNGSHMVGAVSGGGITKVDSDASLTVTSISQGTVTVGSGAILTLSPIPGGPLSGTMLPVPEPSVFVLLAGAFVVFIRRLRR